MTIDPRVGFWFSIAMAIVSALGLCGTQFTTMFGDPTAAKIMAAIVLLNVINSAINAVLHAIPSKPGAANEFALGPKAVPVILLALILGALAFPGGAYAQVKLVRPTGNIARDIAAATGGPTASTSTPSKPGACDITLFSNLSFASVVNDITNCVGSVVSAGATPFVADLGAALDSANTAKDGIAIACLTPALAIAKAAQGTPASADGSTPAIYPGPILIFQKYREFVNAGGPSNCKTAVQSTINGTVASAL